MRKVSQFTPDEDSPLLLSWHRGDTSAFETLIWKYQKRVFNLAIMLTGVEKTACEVVENSFVSAYQNIRSLKSTDRFSSWLVALTLKECREFNNYRGEEAESPVEPDLTATDEISYAAALHKKLELCIRELPSELSEVILLRYVRNYPLDRVEEILQISGEMVLARLFEAQETLACWLKSDTEDPAELATMKSAASSIHPEVRKNFSAYLDSSVEGTGKELTKIHLKSCGSCREALAELEWMVEDIKGIPDVEPPHWLAASIMHKVKSSPAKPAKMKEAANLKIQIAVAALFIAVIGISSYLLQSRPEFASGLPRSENQSVSSGPVARNGAPRGTNVKALPQGVFGGTPNMAGSPQGAGRTAAPPPFPLPTALPSGRELPADPSIKTVQAVAGVKGDRIQKKEKPEALQTGLQEWGDPLPATRVVQNKAPQVRVRNGEVVIESSSPDSAATARDIESAISAIGGKISGRGNDILYTSVEVERLGDLMGRLARIGRIQELSRLPDGSEGTIDLVIRW